MDHLTPEDFMGVVGKLSVFPAKQLGVISSSQRAVVIMLIRFFFICIYP